MRRRIDTANISAVLFGVSFLMVAALKATHLSERTLGDELAWFAGLLFLGSLALSFLVVEREVIENWQRTWGHRAFLAALAILMGATLLIGFDLH